MFTPVTRKIIFLLFFIAGKNSFGQVLLTGNHNLNAGGVVYDVGYDSALNVYIVVGQFTSINGIPRTNLAAINGTTLNAMGASLYNIITSIDGPINTVLVTTNRIFIGGSFTMVNGSPRYGLAMFDKTSGVYVLNSWAPLNLCATGSENVKTLELFGDTLMVCGSFTYAQNSPTTCLDKPGIAAYNVTFLNYIKFAEYIPSYSAPEVNGIFKKGNYYYLAGYDLLMTDSAGNSTVAGAQTALVRIHSHLGYIDESYMPSWTPSGGEYYIRKIAPSEFGIYTAYGSHLGAPALGRQDLNTGASLSININDPSNLPVFYDPHDLHYYHKKLYYGSRDLSGTTASPHFGYRNILDVNPFWSGSLAPAFNNGSITRIGSRMFVSENNLTSIAGSTRTGLSIFCVEPYNPSPFVVYDSTICPGFQNQTFSIPQVPYAKKYHWFYTGAGVDINGTGSGDVILPAAFYYTVSIDFSTTFTAGQLCVVPMSDCDERADTMKINIYVNPVPNANAGLDTSLTCKFSSINLNGSSTTPGAAFSWAGPFSYTAAGATATIGNIGNYTLTVTDPVYGCSNTDLVAVVYDTVRPDVQLPLPPYQLTCSDTVKLLDGSSADLQTVLTWRNVSSGALFPDPYMVNTAGQYRLIVTDTLNGCPDSLSLIVTAYQPIPNLMISGYSSIATTVPLDTVTCYNPLLTLNGYSDSIGTVVYFTDSLQTVNYSNSIPVDSGGFYYLFAVDTASGCTNFVMFNVNAFLNPPDLSIAPVTELNCSVDSVLLDASSVLSTAQLIWNGVSFSNQPDPIITHTPGWYSITNTRTDNGCSLTDSVLVAYTPTLLVSTGNDTMVCPGTTLNLTANVMGGSGISYTWDNGTTTSINSIIVSGLHVNTVQVSDTTGCSGSDTIITNVPPVPVDSIVAYRPCSGDSTGQLVVFLSAGLVPYTYSLDGITYQALNQFTGLPIGNYTVYVNDSLGCDYLYNTTITKNSSLPQPLFLNSNYNMVGDTIALVDVSIPVPDSTNWDIPAAFSVLQWGNPVFILTNDTGTFQITLYGYYGGCEVSISKDIFVKQFDTLTANLYNENGIKELRVYPNPNSGTFWIELEFYKQQDYFIGIYDATGYKWFSAQENESHGTTYPVALPLSATSGTYVLQVISEFDARTFNFVINR